MKTLKTFLAEAQSFSSAATSIRGKEVAALVKLHKKGMFDGAQTALDYGAGKYGRNAEWLRKQGVDTFAYDKFNGGSGDGWKEGVSLNIPNGHQFDIGFTSYVLNVVPEAVEAEIIRDIEGRTKGKVFHITRGTDVTETIWQSVRPGGKRNKYIMAYLEKNNPEFYAKIEADQATKEDAKAIGEMGVQTAKDSYQRIPDLTKYGYKRSGSGGSVVWTK